MPSWVAVAVGGMLALAACGSSPSPRVPSDTYLRPLYEVQAFEVIRRTAIELGFTPEPKWSITLVGSTPLTVDFRLGETPFGIEWVSAEDRDAVGAALPNPDPHGQLRIVPGVGEDWQAQVLVVDHRVYQYDADPERVRRGAPGQREVERKLEQDIRDYLEYVRSQL